MDKPRIAHPKSIVAEVEKGEKYAWCACGLSETQPFCDGKHRGTKFSPIKFIADETKKIAFCGCKHSKNGMYCDGTHKSLVVSP